MQASPNPNNIIRLPERYAVHFCLSFIASSRASSLMVPYWRWHRWLVDYVRWLQCTSSWLLYASNAIFLAVYLCNSHASCSKSHSASVEVVKRVNGRRWNIWRACEKDSRYYCIHISTDTILGCSVNAILRFESFGKWSKERAVSQSPRKQSNFWDLYCWRAQQTYQRLHVKITH